jgi:hypothetical protein
MHGPINVKSLNDTNKWQMGFNSAFKGLNGNYVLYFSITIIEENREIRGVAKH